MLLELAGQGGRTDTLMIDATHLKTHRTASSPGLKKGGRGRLIGRTKGGMNSKLTPSRMPWVVPCGCS